MSLLITHYKQGWWTVEVPHDDPWPDMSYTLGHWPKNKPNFPVPAIPIKVGWCPEHPMQMYPSAYWYVASRFLLWSFFQKWGFVKETV